MLVMESIFKFSMYLRSIILVQKDVREGIKPRNRNTLPENSWFIWVQKRKVTSETRKFFVLDINSKIIGNTNHL